MLIKVKKYGTISIEIKMNMKKQQILPALLLVIFVPIALFAFFVIGANVFVHDEAPPDVSSFRLPPIRLDDSENAYRKLEPILQSDRFSNEPDQTLTSVVAAEGWDAEYASELIDQHAEDIFAFRAAAQAPAYLYPGYADFSSLTLASIEYPDLSPIRKAAEVTALDARSRARAGDSEGAIVESLEIVRVGQAMQNGRGVLIDYLVGSAIKQTGLTALRRIAEAADLSAERSLALVNELETFRDSREAEVAALTAEASLSLRFFPNTYRELVDSFSLSYDSNGTRIRPGFFDWVNAQIPPVTTREGLSGWLTQATWAPIAFSGMTTYYYQPNRTKRFLLEDAGVRIANANTSCDLVDFNPETRRLPEYAGPRGFFQRNAVGNIVVNIGQISYGGLSKKRCDESLAVSATELVVAARAYAQDHGSIPARLIDLVPSYLPEVPLDPYTGTPMQYDAEQGSVYSFGANRVDAGVSEEADWQKAENPSFSLE